VWRRDDGDGEQKEDDARLMAVQCVRLRRFIAATAAAAMMTHVAAGRFGDGCRVLQQEVTAVAVGGLR